MPDLTDIPEKRRAYFYRISLAALALAVTLKLVASDQVGDIASLIAAILGVGNAGLATANTSTKG